MGILTSFWERKYGKGRITVDFTNVECLKENFSHPNEIEKYGLAINSAKAMMKKRWFLTEQNILVCGNIPELRIYQVSIDVEERNIPFLLSQYRNEIQEGFVVPTIIEGLDISREEDGKLRPGYWAIFSTPK